MSYKIGQTFENDYPTDAVKWASEHNAYILQSGLMFTIVANSIPTVEEIKATLLRAVDTYLDTTVQERGYDNIAKCVTYEGDIDPIFNREGTVAKQWRSKVYRKCYDILDEVMNGLREIPTEEELINELPKIDWGDGE